ncbi:MAG TPA: hypothetical protein V6C81_12140 [Planktothrix sp.]|jgi:hypothetical protein
MQTQESIQHTEPGQLAQAFFQLAEHERGYAGDDPVMEFYSTFDKGLTPEYVHENRAYVLEVAAALHDFAASVRYADNAMHVPFANLAINLLMLVVEDDERNGAAKETVQPLLDTAADIAAILLTKFEWSKELPPAARILGTWTYLSCHAIEPETQLLCNVDAARQRIVAIHEDRSKRKRTIERSLSQAHSSLSDSASLVRRCMHEFYEIVSGDRLLRAAQASYFLHEGKAWILAGEQYCQSIDEQDISPENVNRAKRAVAITRLIEAQVKAQVAVATVDAVKHAGGYKDFEVLGYQARAYAEATTLNNWTYFAPPIFARPELEMAPENDRWLRMFDQYSDAAISYATALKAELYSLMQPARRLHQPKFVEIPIERGDSAPVQDESFDAKKRSVLDDFSGMPPCVWKVSEDGTSAKVERTIKAAEFPKADFYRPPTNHMDLTSEHHRITGDNLREDHHYGYGRREQYHAKQRLVGFDRFNGRGRRRSKKAKVA